MTTVPTDAWDPFTPETAADARVEAVKARFAGREPLIARAERRTVSDHDGSWIVAGDPKLGDAHPSYLIWLNPESHKYVCSCHASAWGDVREHKMCSHVLAVVFHRKRGPVDQEAAGVPGPDPGAVVGGPTPPALVAAAPAASAPHPHDPRFGTPPLPVWVKAFRSHQWAAVEEAVAHFLAGVRVVLVDAPTGSGKTLIGELIRRELAMKAIYTCTTKTLQDQVLADYPYAKILKGRSNYPTLNHPDRFGPEHGYDRITCEDCTKAPGSGCDFCFDTDACPYEIDKKAALTADLAVLNTAYLLAEANHVGRFAKEPRLAIADECDELEGALMGFAQITVGPRDRARLNLDMPARKTVEAAWVEWLDAAVAAARAEVGTFLRKPANPQQAKRKRKWERKVQQLEFVREGVAASGWIYDHTKADWVTFKPVTVDAMANDLLWRHAPRWLCMSATVISPEQMAAELGLTDGEYAYVSVPSTFPAERRPVRVVPKADLTYKTRDTEWPRAAAALQSILDRHPGESVLAHTQSYWLNNLLFDHLAAKKDRPILTYHDAHGREQALAAFRSIEGSVLLAPSLERGVSLDDEACRVVVVVKVPFPSTGDPQVSQRLHGTGRAGDVWYAVKTVRSLVQSTGRGMRHADDRCEIYILDKQFLRFYRRNGRLFPRWWKDALDMHFDSRQL